MILDVFLILNVIALMQISVFQVKLGVKSKLRFSNTSTLIIALILSVLGLLITFLSSEMLIGGILTGTGIASLIDC